MAAKPTPTKADLERELAAARIAVDEASVVSRRAHEHLVACRTRVLRAEVALGLPIREWAATRGGAA